MSVPVCLLDPLSFCPPSVSVTVNVDLSSVVDLSVPANLSFYVDRSLAVLAA